MSQFVDTLRAQLVDAAAHQAPVRRRRPAIPVWRVVATAAATAAAIALLLATVVTTSPDGGPVDTPPPPERLEERPLFGGSLEPGVRYRTRALIPSVSFVVGDDRWFVNETSSSQSLVVERRAGTREPGGETRPVEFLAFDRIPRIVDPSTGRDAPAPPDLVAWLARHPDLRAAAPVRTTIGGLAATRLDTRVAFDRPAVPSQDCRRNFMIECTRLAPLFHFEDGVRVRWYVLDGGAQPFAVTVIGVGEAAFERALERTRPILDSLRIDR